MFFDAINFDVWVSMICLSLAGAFLWSCAAILRNAASGGGR